MVIRKRMNPKKWKSLQKLSYIFYGLLFVHIAMIFSISILNGYLEKLFDLTVYAVIYVVYLVLRAIKYKKQRVLCVFFIAIICVIYTVLAVLGFRAAGKHEEEAVEEQNAQTTVSSDASYKDGTYEGSATGYGGKMKVSVTIANGEITEINIVDTGDDEEYLIDARDVIPEIIEKQSLDVDTVSGATHSCKGIIKAVGKALESARGE